MKDLLPIGSVVLLKEATKSLMIIGTTQIDDENNQYDYVACMFPEGYIDEETFFLFNHEDILQIEFVGCINAESQAYVQAIKSEELKNSEEGEENGQ